MEDEDIIVIEGIEYRRIPDDCVGFLCEGCFVREKCIEVPHHFCFIPIKYILVPNEI